jgi:TonB family protein
MRARPFVIIPLICSAQALAQSGIAAETRPSATSLYQSQVSAIALQAVIPEFAKHRERLKPGSVKVTFQLDKQGRVKGLKVASTKSNQWAEATAIRMIRVAKFPPIPKKVIAEQGHDWVDVEAEWSFGSKPSASNQTMPPTAGQPR